MADNAQAETMSFRAKHVRQLRKTEMCKYFLKNKCTKGASCAFGHNPCEIREKPDLNCTSMCRSFLQSGNCNDPKCTYAHNERQLRTTQGFFKTKLCRFAARGRCKHGISCRFAHDVRELDNTVGGIDGTMPTGGSDDSVLGHRTTGSGESSSGGDQSNQGDSTDQSPPAVMWQTTAHGDWADSTSDPSESTRAETSFSFATPEGSGDSGQEEHAAANSYNVRRNVHLDERNRRAERQPAPQRGAGATNARQPQQADGARVKVSRCTTMMITNVPNFLTQGALVSLFEDLTICMRGTFDFFYCPWDPYQDRNLGHAIINFYSKSIANQFERQWSDQLLLPRTPGQKRLRIVPAALQGRAANLRHFSGFPLAHHADPRFRPLVRANPNEALRPMAIAEELTASSASQQGTTQMNDMEIQYGQAECMAGMPENTNNLQPRRDLMLNLLGGGGNGGQQSMSAVGYSANASGVGLDATQRMGTMVPQALPQGMAQGQGQGAPNAWNAGMSFEGGASCPIAFVSPTAETNWMGKLLDRGGMSRGEMGVGGGDNVAMNQLRGVIPVPYFTPNTYSPNFQMLSEDYPRQYLS